MAELVTLPSYETLLTEFIRSLAIDSGSPTVTPPAGIAVLQDDTKNWPVDAHRGRLVKIIRGVGLGQTRAVRSNTANVLSLDSQWTILPNQTSVYVILGDSARKDRRASYTGTGNITPAAVRSTAAGSFKAVKVQIHWSVATSNPVTIAVDANAGAAYDTVLHVETLGANTDMVYYFPAGAKFEAGDVITVAWTDDTGGVATWGVQIGWEE